MVWSAIIQLEQKRLKNNRFLVLWQGFTCGCQSLAKDEAWHLYEGGVEWEVVCIGSKAKTQYSSRDLHTRLSIVGLFWPVLIPNLLLYCNHRPMLSRYRIVFRYKDLPCNGRFPFCFLLRSFFGWCRADYIANHRNFRKEREASEIFRTLSTLT